MKCRYLTILCCFFISFIFYRVQSSAQNKADPFPVAAMENAMAVYHHSFGDQIALYNGKRYIEYPFRFGEGDPYFNIPEPVTGSVFYDGVRYDSVQMRYNEISDELIINYYNEKIQLLKPRLEWFAIPAGYFIKLKKDSANSELVSSGFYNVLYNGAVRLLKKEIKSIQLKQSINLENLDYIEQHDHYYLQVNGTYHSIKRKKDVLVLFAGKKKEVQQFIRKNGLSFRRDRQNMLMLTTSYYDSLKK